VIVIEFHARETRVRGGERAEGGHAAAVDVERADGEEVEEEPIGGFGGVGDVLREGGVVGYGVEDWGVEFGECWVRVLTVEAFLEAVDPGMSVVGTGKGGKDAHGFPVEATFVGDAAAVWQFSEIDGIGEVF
jgi:hypothetical protein